jgi:vancomycin permeability regulator SanA
VTCDVRIRSAPQQDVTPPEATTYERDQVRDARSPRRHHWVRVAICLTLALIIVTPLVAAFRVWYVARQDDRTRSDAIVVLGAAQFNGRPSPVLQSRLLHALDLYRAGVARRIVTVGGNKPGDRYTEAHAGKDWLNEHGVPLTALDAVPTGSDTLQSIVAVAREFDHHSWRSVTMARDNRTEAVTSPTRGGPTVGSRDTQAHYILRETGGYLYYVMIGRYQ